MPQIMNHITSALTSVFTLTTASYLFLTFVLQPTIDFIQERRRQRQWARALKPKSFVAGRCAWCTNKLGDDLPKDQSLCCYCYTMMHYRQERAYAEAHQGNDVQPVHEGIESTNLSTVSDTAVISSESRDGLIFAETTETISSDLHAMGPLRESVQDKPDALDLLRIPVRIAQGSWTTSQTQNTVLYNVNYNTAHTLVDRWAQVFNKYIFYRYRLKIRVEVDGTPFHQGKLMLYYSPGLPINPQYVSVLNLNSLDHRSLYPAYNNVQELIMPWQYHFDYARQDPNSTFNSFANLVVFNALEAGTGAVTSIDYSVYLSFEDVELKVPAPVTVPAALLATFEDSMPTVEGFLDFTTVNNNFSNISNSTLPTNVTGDSFDTKVDVKGLDYPNWTLNPSPIKVRALDSMSNTTGPSSNFRLALDPSKLALAGPEVFDTADDEMTFKHLLSRWSPIAINIPFSASSVTGTPIFSCSVNPGLLGGSLANSNNPSPAYRPLLQMVAQRFSRWRGSVCFAVEIIATQYQTGKLFLGFHPYYTAPIASTAGNPDNLTNYGMVVEINKGKNLFEITIPYYAMANWTNVRFSDSATNPTIFDDRYGYFFIAPVNKLAYPSGVPTAVRVNVFVKAGPDFEFSIPFGVQGYANIQGDGTIGRYRGPSRGVDHLLDVPGSLKDLIRRPFYWTGGQLLPGSNGAPWKYFLVPLDTVVSQFYETNVGNAQRMGNNMAYWMSLFRGYVGDLRVKVVLTRKSTNLALDGSFKGIENDYPVYVSHFPTISKRTGTDPTNPDIVKAVEAYLNARYSQSGPSATILQPPNTSNSPAWGDSGTMSAGSQQPIALFEEMIVDPIRVVDIEVPFNGTPKFATRAASSAALAGIEDAHSSGWGFLIIHSWANHFSEEVNNAYEFSWVDLHVGAADNLRFGMHTGTPNIGNTNATASNPFGRFEN